MLWLYALATVAAGVDGGVFGIKRITEVCAVGDFVSHRLEEKTIQFVRKFV